MNENESTNEQGEKARESAGDEFWDGPRQLVARDVPIDTVYAMHVSRTTDHRTTTLP